MVFLKSRVGASMCKASFTGSEPFDSNPCINTNINHITLKQNPWVYVVFFERYLSWLYACNTPFHMSETPEQNRQHHFEETKYFLQRQVSFRVRLSFIKDVLHLSTYCIAFFFCKNVACYLRKDIVFRAIILKTLYKSFIKTWP